MSETTTPAPETQTQAQTPPSEAKPKLSAKDLYDVPKPPPVEPAPEQPKAEAKPDEPAIKPPPPAQPDPEVLALKAKAEAAEAELARLKQAPQPVPTPEAPKKKDAKAIALELRAQGVAAADVAKAALEVDPVDLADHVAGQKVSELEKRIEAQGQLLQRQQYEFQVGLLQSRIQATIESGADFETLRSLGTSPAEVWQRMEAEGIKTGKLPDFKDVLTKMEAEQTERVALAASKSSKVKAKLAPPAPAAPPKPTSPTITASMSGGTGTPTKPKRPASAQEVWAKMEAEGRKLFD